MTLWRGCHIASRGAGVSCSHFGASCAVLVTSSGPDAFRLGSDEYSKGNEEKEKEDEDEDEKGGGTGVDEDEVRPRSDTTSQNDHRMGEHRCKHKKSSFMATISTSLRKRSVATVLLLSVLPLLLLLSPPPLSPPSLSPSPLSPPLRPSPLSPSPLSPPPTSPPFRPWT